MDSYTFSLALGGAGLVAMAATGMAHPGVGPHSGTVHGSAHVTHHAGQHGDGHGDLRGGAKSALMALATPRAIFSLLIGFGLSGIVVRQFAGGLVLLVAAVLGALIFEGAIVRPLWTFLFRFASAPAGSLEGALMDDATATSGFDDNGQGLVAVEVDGQIVQCLGTLRAEDRELGVRVRAGDRLRVEAVDPKRSRCTVSFVARKVLHSS